eukprot:1725209-Rhodomonas_salina.1
MQGEEPERGGRNDSRQDGSSKPNTERTQGTHSVWDQRRDRAKENNDRQVEMDWEEEERERRIGRREQSRPERMGQTGRT